MISRRSAKLIAEVYLNAFSKLFPPGILNRREYVDINKLGLYDFLFENSHDIWLCNKVKNLPSIGTKRSTKDFLMQLHTGESLQKDTLEWSWEQRQSKGQQYLHKLAEDVLNHWHELAPYYKEKLRKQIEELRSNLELDGYDFRNSRLLIPEQDVLDVKEESGVLESLYSALNLDNKELVFHHLGLSEEDYHSKKWDNSISNSRKFLECVQKEVAASHHFRKTGKPLARKTYDSAKETRDYLEDNGLLELKEKQTLAKIYGLLSNTGSHPYMAEKDQARLMRHLALTFSQFLMLRLQGFLVANS